MIFLVIGSVGVKVVIDGPTLGWCNAEEHCRIWNFKRGFRVRFPSAAEKNQKSLWGGETGIYADLSSAFEERKTSVKKVYNEKNLHCGKQPRKKKMLGARPGVPNYLQKLPPPGIEPGAFGP